jgi:hypothetical protein
VDIARTRQSAQLVRAPRDGRIQSLNTAAGATLVSAGDWLATLAPERAVRVVELMVDGRDVALVRPGQPVRLHFEGWPAIQFSGWPSVAQGMFDGRVRSIDPSAQGTGLFRVLVEPMPGKPGWPDDHFTRLGSRVAGSRWKPSRSAMNCGASSTTFRWNSSARWKPARARGRQGPGGQGSVEEGQAGQGRCQGRRGGGQVIRTLLAAAAAALVWSQGALAAELTLDTVLQARPGTSRWCWRRWPAAAPPMRARWPRKACSTWCSMPKCRRARWAITTMPWPT